LSASVPPLFLLLNVLVGLAHLVRADWLVNLLCRYKMRRVRAFHRVRRAA
jgi:hypothetical protein